MNSLNPYHMTQCVRSVDHIIWYTVTGLPVFSNSAFIGYIKSSSYVEDSLTSNRLLIPVFSWFSCAENRFITLSSHIFDSTKLLKTILY